MITAKQLKEGMPFAKQADIDRFVGPLNDAMKLFGITTIPRQCSFLAQLAHESGSLRYVKELASGKAYDTGNLAKSLGNTPEADGDGEKYKGRGPIQITGKTNYQALTDYFKVDFINHPELLEQPVYGCAAAGWFWDTRKLNALADQSTAASFISITKKINGGLNGLEDRQAFWDRFKKALI